jgi:cell division protein FtsQ
MWDDPRQLNGASLVLVLFAAAALAWAAVTWLVRQPAFAFREVVIMTPLNHASGAHLESVVHEELAGTFFTLDLDRAGRALARVPWVRSVALRRQWPRRLEIDIVEHEPLARWNDAGLVNTRGEVFSADWNGDLPQFSGPEGQSASVTMRYREWSAMLAPLGLSVRTLALSPRGGWEVAATNGAGSPLTIELGRDDPSGRLARFVTVHDRTIGALAQVGRHIEQVDLRYRNGFAVRVPGFREKPVKKS